MVYCPDCGGVVGAKTVTEAGHPCTCFADVKPKARAAPEPSLDDLGDVAPSEGEVSNDDTAATDSPAASTAPAKQQAEKLCVLCGKNVAGHRRVKDSRGYLCLDCARTEQARNKPQGARCPKCGRIVKEESIAVHDGQRMCQRCLREARELARPGSKRFRKIDDQHFEKANKTQLIVLSAIAAVLLVIMLIGWLKG